ncbi:MAG: DUF3316 domain-containing protein [Bacteroidales bacterium]|nr:DUF3316 domain-containing protein [Candidatus Physcousia equi]
MLLVALLLLIALPAFAQPQAGQDRLRQRLHLSSHEESVRFPREHATTFAIGRVNHYDSYLSPLEYRGPKLTVLYETAHFLRSRSKAATDGAHPRLSFHSLLSLDASFASSPANGTDNVGGGVAYEAGWRYNWHDVILPRLRLQAGGTLGTTAGFLYTTRSGNNPANARLQLRLSGVVAAHYDTRLARLPIHIRYQAELPLVGMAFAPRYGQSYYELSEYGTDRNLGFISPHNALTLRQYLTLDLSFRLFYLRLGYLSDLSQLRLNGLEQHQFARSFVLGWARTL